MSERIVCNENGGELREEIVRCRDCTYYDDEPDFTSSIPKCWRDPEHRGTAIWTHPDGFCAWGERIGTEYEGV